MSYLIWFAAPLFASHNYSECGFQVSIKNIETIFKHATPASYVNYIACNTDEYVPPECPSPNCMSSVSYSRKIKSLKLLWDRHFRSSTPLYDVLIDCVVQVDCICSQPWNEKCWVSI